MIKNILVLSALLTLGVLTPARAQAPAAQKSTLALTSPDFISGESIPAKFTCDGPNTAPALAFQGAPAGTESFALTVDDPDAPKGDTTHWIVYNIPPDTTKIPPLPANVNQGTNSFNKTNYNGPCPPKGDKPHRYFFRLYALDTDLPSLPEASADNAALQQAMKGHVLAQAELVAKYAH